MDIPTDVLVYALVAAVLVVWLSRILGTRSGDERQRPNPFATDHKADKAAGNISVGDSTQHHDAPASPPPPMVTPAIESELVGIALADRSFEPALFVQNAKDAFSIVVTAFAKADLATLKDLLAEDVYTAFEGEIKKREAANHKVVTDILSVDDAEIIGAKLDGTTASVTLRIKAQETYVLSDADGKVLAGHPDRVVEMTDVWTFSRDTRSHDPRWFVSATNDDLKEQDAMTLPDAGTTI